MKRILAGCLLLSVSSWALAAENHGPVAAREDANDPVAPYHDYDAAMAPEPGCPMAVEWQGAAGPALDAAVAPSALADFVTDDAAAAALLAQARGAYDTDPTAATQIAAVSQWVMGEEPCWLCFWKASPADGRKVWVKALVARAEAADDTYVKLFCLDQLRWCGCKCPCVVKRVRAIGDASSDKAVKDMADIVLRTLE